MAPSQRSHDEAEFEAHHHHHHHQWEESPTLSYQNHCHDELDDIDYPMSDGEYDPDDDDDCDSTEDMWYGEYRCSDEEPQEGEAEPKVVRKPLEFADIMDRFPDIGARGPTALYRPPPQYDRGSDSEGEEGEEEVQEGRGCGVCVKRNVKVVYVSCGHGVCVWCAKNAWCKGRMKRFRFPRWLRCQTCKGKVQTVDLVDGEGVYEAGLGVLNWVVTVSERIARMWKQRFGDEVD